MDSNQDTVTLEAFADRVGCHFTTASRLRSGERMPGRELLGRIVEEFGLDRDKAFEIYTQDEDAADKFGRFLREKIFGLFEEEIKLEQEQSASTTGSASHAGSVAA